MFPWWKQTSNIWEMLKNDDLTIKHCGKVIVNDQTWGRMTISPTKNRGFDHQTWCNMMQNADLFTEN